MKIKNKFKFKCKIIKLKAFCFPPSKILLNYFWGFWLWRWLITGGVCIAAGTIVGINKFGILEASWRLFSRCKWFKWRLFIFIDWSSCFVCCGWDIVVVWWSSNESFNGNCSISDEFIAETAWLWLLLAGAVIIAEAAYFKPIAPWNWLVSK